MLTLILNAGGQSRRMGQNKALLRVPTSGQPLLGHMLQRLAPLGFTRMIVVTNQAGLAAELLVVQPVVFVADDYPGVGPLGGIATGLALCEEWAVVLACDLPLINSQVVQTLAALAHERDLQGNYRWQAVVPRVEGYAQPLHACYHRSVLPIIIEKMAQGERRADSFLSIVRTRWVAEEELRPYDARLYSFVNVNTPEEWARACTLLQNPLLASSSFSKN